jgi:hypothetical protein
MTLYSVVNPGRAEEHCSRRDRMTSDDHGRVAVVQSAGEKKPSPSDQRGAGYAIPPSELR